MREWFTKEQLERKGKVEIVSSKEAENVFHRKFPFLRPQCKVMKLTVTEYYIHKCDAWRKPQNGEMIKVVEL